MGYAMTTQWGGANAAQLQMIGFDMGGTSTGLRTSTGPLATAAVTGTCTCCL